MRVLYGDGGIGIMGALAAGVLAAGGEIVGIIPQFMVDEGWNNSRSTHTIVTKTMHERKAKIHELADAFVALPGGIGTMEELMECLTWKQLGIHNKPVVILNTNHFFDGILRCLDQMIEQQFMREIHRSMYVVVHKPEEVLPALLHAPEWSSDVRRLAYCKQ